MTTKNKNRKINKNKEAEILRRVAEAQAKAELAKKEYSHFGVEVTEYERIKNTGAESFVVSDGIYEFKASLKDFEAHSILRDEPLPDAKEGEPKFKQMRVLEIQYWKVAPIRIEGVLDKKDIGIA